ncbi:hypothetical protein LEMLEM_LOCUS16860 [Lemmus lemmus]|jgi:tetratricopeptide (TPR) repeat protein
MGNH